MPVTDAVIAAEQRRCAAMITGDLDALDVTLAARLQFAHATGTVDDKAGYLAKIAAGRIRYVAIDWSEQRVESLGPDAALLTGRMLTHVSVEGVEKRLDNRVISAWMREGEVWRAVAFQSTPLKA